MTLLGYLLVLTGVVCCTAAPASDTERPKGSCGPPPRFPDRELQGAWTEEFYNPGIQAQYFCRPGYIRLGAIRYVCSEGTWDTVGTTGQCKRKSCGHPGDIEFGTFELKKEESFVFGALVVYTCNDGYQMISKHKTRECTATGWTNYLPECEVRFCPPVQVSNNVNLLTTSYEEEYSVGQVIRFECKNANQKINGASEIFCTSEGDWNAPPPTCEEVKCNPPRIVHGRVNNAKPSYKDKETLGFSCDDGYKPSTNTQITCTKNDWSPTPLCEVIVCYQETVKNGRVLFTKETYSDGDTVTLTCDEGYQIEHKPDEPRTCTTNGWSPSLKCISKKCSRPIAQNGYIEHLNWYSFPMTPSSRSYFYFYCNSGFLAKDKESWGIIYCTTKGWNPEPNCYKKCNVPSQASVNAYLYHRGSQIYLEGDKLRFQCYDGYTTLDAQTHGEIECLPNGRFSEEKCYKTCKTPDLVNGEYKTNTNVFEVGAYFIYKCNEGFISSGSNKVDGISQCGSDGWRPKPECKGVSCTLEGGVHVRTEGKTVKFGEVVHFKCSRSQILEGSNSSQCFYYGWSPAIPVCIGGRNTFLPLIDSTRLEESNCPLISAPPNARVINPKTEYFNEDEIEIACDPGYQLDGSKKVLCKDGKWQSPPWCIEKKLCRGDPPHVINGKINEETLAEQYYSGSSVKYICASGYHFIGSDESKCIDGKWLPAPICVGNSCGNPEGILNGAAQDGSKVYRHGERAAYVCSRGYNLSKNDPALCFLGKWMGVPNCKYSSCGPPPKVINGALKEEKKATYLSGDKVTYECARSYTMGQNANYITCEDSVWTDPPVCRKLGQTCGAPPVVQFGDISDIRSQSYQSGSYVKYKCANLYKLEGKEVITCKDGEWEKEPVCRVPCTVKEADMEQYKIQLKWTADKTKKIYSVHFDNMTFDCRDGYQISDPTLLRIQCLDGVLKYPRCLKQGSCVLQQTEMAVNNVRYNKSTEIENGQTIEFECEEGMVSENGLQATCKNKQIIYPKCSTGRSCPLPKISKAILSPEKQDGYESGSSVNIKCEDTFVLSGHISVKCEYGQWGELPQCLKPCTIIPSSLEKNHIELLPTESAPEILEHSREVNVKCKANFKRPGFLTATCYDGTMKYPRCFSGGTCRLIQNNLDEKFLELDERHENEVFYAEGETISFKCKTGYRNSNELTGTCTKSEENPAEYILIYPTCEEESAV